MRYTTPRSSSTSSVVILDEWNKMDPSSSTIAEHKIDIAKQVIKEGGMKIKKEAYGARNARVKDRGQREVAEVCGRT